VSQTVVQRLAEFAAAPLPRDMAAEITADIVRRVRDLFGVALAAGVTESADVVSAVVARWGGRAESGLIGRCERYPAPAAALVNGTMSHALDFDDTHLPSVLHPSASVVPAALAAAQSAGGDGRELVRAVAVGDEICVRLGMAGYDRAHRASIFFERGLHATSICGAIGSAAAAGVLLGLDANRLSHAMAIAASMGAGILEANRTGGTVKPVHCGWASHGGVIAAELAAAGLTGPPTAVEGRFGWLMAFCGERADADAITAELGERWELLQMHFKPYPANHFTHAGIDAALELRERGLGPDDLAEVQIGVATSTLRTIAQPAAEKVSPRNGYAARFSGPFTFAAAMCGGSGLGVGLDDFSDESAREPRRLALAAKVTCAADPDCDALFPDRLPAVVRVRTVDGGRHEVRVMANRGGPDRPLTDRELELKFRRNAGLSLDASRVHALDAALAKLELLSDVGELLDLTASRK
jgi:2-methylcitrate dehydratase PrpD